MIIGTPGTVSGRQWRSIAVALCASFAATAMFAMPLGAAPIGAMPSATVAAQRAQQAVAAISASNPALAGSNVGLVVQNYLVNERGRTIVHAQQTYQGHPVWGSSAI